MQVLIHGKRAGDTGEVTMRVKVTKSWKDMPQGANVGDEVEIADDQFTELRRLGNVERAKQNPRQNQQDQQPAPGAGQPQDRPQANRSPTAVDPVGTDDWRGRSNQ